MFLFTEALSSFHERIDQYYLETFHTLGMSDGSLGLNRMCGLSMEIC